MDKEQRRRYRVLKLSLLDKEKSNFNKIIALNSGDDWYKIGGNSLLLYLNLVAPFSNKKRLIREDSDFGEDVFEDGVIVFRGLYDLEERLKELNLLKETQRAEGCVAFVLKDKIEPEKIERFRTNLRQENEKTLAIIVPRANILPKLHKPLRIVAKRLDEVTRHLDVNKREMYGYDIARLGARSLEIYYGVVKGLVSPENGWREISEVLGLLQCKLGVALELKYFDRGSVCPIAKEIVVAREIVAKEILKLEKHGG